MRKRHLVSLTAAAFVFAAGPGALADNGDETPAPEPPSQIGTYESNIFPLEQNIYQLDQNIEDLNTDTQEGSTKVVTLNSDILFDYGSNKLSDPAKKRIGELVKDVPQGATVKVDGHTDNIPYRRGNDVLSKERAQAVADAISAARGDLKLEVAGHGDTKPVEPNKNGDEDNPEGRAKNRRVEIRYDG
ncbi:OmpA family protein [Dermabacter hominis]|uniref:OmpA family protein n=1 Tax=Dermabacter hominis TaxID=36740 RepID=UPI0021A32761|nr:OmpA family protein [Dermabacter hominis]MCT1956502.1 OmpA family protein [Dermabacter hominis]